MNKIDLKHLAGYEEDFALWSAEQSALIRAGKLDRVDLENVAEEIESLGRSDRQQIRNRMIVVLHHLLKWEFQPSERSNSWASTIVEQRGAINDLIEESPSLSPYPQSILARSYEPAPLAAAGDTGLPLETFPSESPYSAEQVLDPGFWPGGHEVPARRKTRRKT